MHTSQYTYTINRLLVYIYILIICGCTDFSQFDCFEAEKGCSPISDPNPGYQSAGLPTSSDPWVQGGQVIMNDMILDGSDQGPLLDQGPLADQGPLVDLSFEECNSNVGLAPCQSCVNGQVQVDDQAGGCPIPDCSRFNEFRKEVSPGGVSACIEVSYTPKEQLCEQGSCLGDFPAACVAQEEIIATVNLPECVTMDGCSGQEGASLIVTAGQACNGENGVCTANGECMNRMAPNASCPQISNARFCGNSLPNSQDCNYQVDLLWGLGWLSYKDCDEFCEEARGRCIGAWNASSMTCQSRNTRDCGTRGGLAICRCAF